MATKIEIIKGAYSQLRISGLTVQPESEDVRTAIDRLEDMMAELEGRNLLLGYNFEEDPDPNSPTQVERKFHAMMKANLAVRLVPDFNKAVPQTLSLLAASSMSSASGAVAMDNMRQVQPSRRMPKGSGNRYNRYTRFQRPVPVPPVNDDYNFLHLNDINDYTESFEAYLGDETIASFTITAETGLQLNSSSKNDTTVTYQAQAVSLNEAWRTVTIVITTSTNRVETRVINFQIGS